MLELPGTQEGTCCCAAGEPCQGWGEGWEGGDGRLKPGMFSEMETVKQRVVRGTAILCWNSHATVQSAWQQNHCRHPGSSHLGLPSLRSPYLNNAFISC